MLSELLTAEGRLKFRIQRKTKKLLERYAQSEARMDAADKLREIGTPEAIFGLARRFSATSENSRTDQEEKKHVQEILLSFGEKAVEPLKRYVRGHDKVTWALDALKQLQSADDFKNVLFETLKKGDAVQIRGAKAVQILKTLESLEDASVVSGVLPCLSSADDTVRYAAVECLAAYADEAAREPLLETLTSADEDSVRVKIGIAEAFVKLGWQVKGFRKKVESALPEPFRVTSKGQIVR